MLGYKFPLTRIFPFKDRIFDSVFIHENMGQRKPEYWRIFPVDTGRELNVHKTFRRRPEHFLNVLYTFNLRPVSIELHSGKIIE